jgi:hypothetical protein
MEFDEVGRLKDRLDMKRTLVSTVINLEGKVFIQYLALILGFSAPSLNLGIISREFKIHYR